MFFRTTELRELKGRFVTSFWLNLGIRYKLKYFIQMNSLYLTEDTKKTIHEEGQRKVKNRIQLSIRAKWKFEKNQFGDKILILRLLKDGSSLDNLLYDKGGQLQSLFKRKMLSKEDSVEFVEFRFLWKKSDIQDNLDLSEKIEKVKVTGSIRLSKEFEWKYYQNPGMLISGNSGSGKSYLLFSIIKGMMKETSNENIYICDGKFDELADVCRNQFKLEKVAKDENDIISYIKTVSSKMDFYYQNPDLAKGLKPIFLVVDEYAALQLVLDKKDFLELNRSIKNIILKGRRLGIEVVIAMQRASADSIDLAIRDNCSVKIGLGNLSAENFKMVFGKTRDDNEIWKFREDEKGKGYISYSQNEPKFFESPNISL